MRESQEDPTFMAARRPARASEAVPQTRLGLPTGQAPVSAQYPGHVWLIDCQADNLEDDTVFKIASMIDEHTRLIRDDTVNTSITGEDFVNILERLALAKWADGVVDLALMPTGEPWKDKYVESSHSL